MSVAATTYANATRAPSRGRIGVKVGGAVVAVAVMLGGYWTLGQVTGPARADGYGHRWHPVAGGMLRLDTAAKVRSKQTTDGFKRFSLTVTLAAEDRMMIVDTSSFRIDGYHVYLGMEPIKSSPSVTRIKPGDRARISLTYQVTKEADDFSLMFEGGAPLPFTVTKPDPVS